MFPYLLFVAVLLVFYYRKNPIMMLLTLVAFAVLRYDVGWDYMSYYEFSSDEGSLALARERYSVVWYWLFETAHGLKMPHLGIAIPAVLTSVAVYLSVRMFCDKDEAAMSDSLLVYALWPFFYLGSFSTIRQSLAVALGLLIFALLYKRRWIWALVVCLFNLLIHPSSLLILVYLPLALIPRRIPILVALVLFGGVVMALRNWLEIIVLMDVDSFNEYAETYMDQEDQWGRMLSFLLGAIALYLFAIAWWDKGQSVWINKLLIVVAIAMAVDTYIYLSDLPSVITRTISYFSIFLIWVFYPSLQKLPYPKVCRFSLTCALVLLFFIYLDQASRSTMLTDVNTSSGFIPYTTVLLK